jgi:Cof subfamily protein (haloacid dehalogenase superfamily)
MSIKLIAVDMDGTILRTDKTVSAHTTAALQKAVECGCIVVPASGRVANNLPKNVLSLPGIRYAVTSNGASVVDLFEKRSVYSDPMDSQTPALLRELIGGGFFAEAYCGGSAYSDRAAFEVLLRRNPPEKLLEFIRASQIFVDDLPGYLESRGTRVEKINIPFLPPEEREGIYHRLEAAGKYTLCSSLWGNIEINRADCSKGRALEHLIGLLGIRREEVLAVGDGGNDLEMLRFAGIGVAMKNALPEVLAAADFVTASNDEDGAALAIEKFALA